MCYLPPLSPQISIAILHCIFLLSNGKKTKKQWLFKPNIVAYYFFFLFAFTIKWFLSRSKLLNHYYTRIHTPQLRIIILGNSILVYDWVLVAYWICSFFLLRRIFRERDFFFPEKKRKLSCSYFLFVYSMTSRFFFSNSHSNHYEIMIIFIIGMKSWIWP